MVVSSALSSIDADRRAAVHPAIGFHLFATAALLASGGVLVVAWAAKTKAVPAA